MQEVALGAETELAIALAVDEVVEVFGKRGLVQWRGVVETSAPHLSCVWIRTDVGERKLVDIREHSIRRVQGKAGG